jgi:hypothetical protein
MPEKLSQGPRIGYDSRVGAGLSRGPNTKKTMVAAAWSNTWPAPGATLDLDFANNRGFVRGLGQGGVMDGITFTRASVGKYVDQDGLLVEAGNNVPRFDWAGTGVVAQRNLFLFTEAITSYWSGEAVSVTLNAATTPAGYSAALVTETSTNAEHRLRRAPVLASSTQITLTQSAVVKPNGRQFLTFIPQADGMTPRVVLDVVNNTYVIASGFGSQGGLFISCTSTALSDGWYRVALSWVTSLNPNSINLVFQLANTSSNGVGYLGDGTSGMYIGEPQVEFGSTATDYQARGAQLPTNTPLRPAETCNGLLIEEARTNRLLWCRDATQTNWTKTDITPAKDQTGIDGVANAASSLTATADGGTCIQTITLASGSRTGSVYLKRLTGTGVVQVSLDGSTWSTAELSDTEWRRIVLSGTVTNPVVGVRLAVSGDAVAMDYGQVEDGGYETTPILTTSATATRAVDLGTTASSQGPLFISFSQGTILWRGKRTGTGQTASEGTAFELDNAEFQRNSIQLMYDNGSFNRPILRLLGQTTTFTPSGVAGSSPNFIFGEPEATIIGSFAQGNSVVGINGVLGSVATQSFEMPMPTRLKLSTASSNAQGSDFNGTIKRISIWPKRLTNEILAKLFGAEL